MENLVAYHLSRLQFNGESSYFDDEFLDQHLFSVQQVAPWYANIVNYFITQELPTDLPRVKKEKIKK